MHLDPRMLAAVGTGGACGGLLRAALEEWRPAGDGWPRTTLAVNLVRVALPAWAATRLAERLRPSTYPRAPSASRRSPPQVALGLAAAGGGWAIGAAL